MNGTALALALAAAAIHTGWNLRLAGVADTRAGSAVAITAAAVCLAPFTLLAWDVDAAAVPLVVASAAFEVAYLVLLARAYAEGELSLVYPVSRGAAPVLVLVVSVAALGASISLAAAAGVLLVAAGVLLVRGPGRAPLAPALAIAACIAGYTLVDNEGVEHAAALPYLGLVLALTAAVYVPFAARGPDGPAALRAALTPGTVLAGAGMAAAYALVLAALERAPAAPVAAVRETSVVIATALAAVLLGERVTPARLAGAAVVATGVAALALA